jgi:hypothetical protein
MKNMFTNFRAAGLIAAAITAALLLFAGCEQESLTETGRDFDVDFIVRETVIIKDERPKEGVKAVSMDINNENDLFDFAKRVSSGYPDLIGNLQDDIELHNQWTPIGQISSSLYTKYRGTFNGNNHTISGVNVKSDVGFTGFFAINNGTIRDLTVAGTISVSPSTDTDYVGGIVGYNDINGSITRVISQVTVTGDGNLTHNIGGIAGFNGWDSYNSDSPHYNDPYRPGGYIFQCRNEGNITGGFNKIGGIAGENAYLVVECVNTGTILCTKTQSGWPGVGGIVGRNGNNNTATEKAHIQSCYNRGEVIDKTGASTSQNAYGGITGWCNDTSDVMDCYTTGALTPSSGAKNPIIGQADSTPPERGVNNYSLNSIYAASSNVVLAGTRRSQADMQSLQFVSDLNVAGAGPYVAVSGGYPKLIWEN